MTANKPVSIRGGDTLRLEYRCKTPSKAPADLSSWSFEAVWRPTPKNPRSIPFEVDETQKANGIIVLTMTHEETMEMDGPGIFDLQGIQGTTRHTFLERQTIWAPGVTRG